MPPQAVAIAPTAAATRWTKTSRASAEASRTSPDASPESPASPDSCSSACASSASSAAARAADREARRDRRSRTGWPSALPRAVRIPSSCRRNGRRAPPSRSSRRRGGRRRGARRPPARRPTARRSRGSRSGGPPTPRASARGPRSVEAAAGIVRWKAVSKTATCGMSGSASRARRIASSARRVVERREHRELVDRLLDRAVDEHRADEARVRRGRPGGRPHPPGRIRRPVRASPRTRWSLRLVEPALTTSTSTKGAFS